jgi:hypothetical protein
VQKNLESTILIFHRRSIINASTKTLNKAPPAVEVCYDKIQMQPILVKIQHMIEKEKSAETRAI